MLWKKQGQAEAWEAGWQHEQKKDGGELQTDKSKEESTKKIPASH